MGWPQAEDWIGAWLNALGRASLYGSLAITGAWLICRALPRISPAAKSWIWRLVYLKLILLLLWPGPIPVSLLPNPGVRIERSQAPARIRSAVREPSGDPRDPSPGAGETGRRESGPATARFASVAAFGIWLSGIFLIGIRTLRSSRATRQTLRASRVLTDPRVAHECEVLSRDLGLNRSPELLCSNAVSAPQAVDVRRRVLLFPSWFVDRFSVPEIRLVLAHELAHIRRHDLLWGWLRRVINGLLFFHPLVWVAHEQATLADEIACDETALRVVNANVSDYAGILMRVTEESLLMPNAAPALLGTGMSRAYRAIASRLQACNRYATSIPISPARSDDERR